MRDREVDPVGQLQTPTLADVYRPLLRPGDYEPRRDIPEHDPKCPNCGYPFDAEEWDERHLTRGPHPGEDWFYTCPKCNNETLGCGT